MMNERVQELVRGAIADAWMQSDRDGDMDKMYIPALFAENFAELIIRECIRSVEDVVSGRACVDYDWIVKQTKRTAIEKIKLKFGFEE